jgi:hypothetical protein
MKVGRDVKSGFPGYKKRKRQRIPVALRKPEDEQKEKVGEEVTTTTEANVIPGILKVKREKKKIYKVKIPRQP